MRWRDGIIELEPLPIPVTLEKRGRRCVARPTIKLRPLGASGNQRVPVAVPMETFLPQ